MKVIVMGCGRVGEELCRIMVDDGHEVTIVDYDAAALERLGADFKGRKIHGVGFDRDVLLRAGIAQADAFAATSSSDSANVVAARIAQDIFKVPRVVARLFNPRSAEVYQRLGLVTVSSASWGAERIHELLAHRDFDPVMAFGSGEASLLRIEAPPHLIGRQVRDLSVPGEMSIVVIVREGRAALPTPGTEFHAGDILYLAALASAMERIENMLGVGAGV